MDDLMLYGLVWAVCAIGAYLVAQSKRDPSPGMWAIVGLILGPVGVALAFFAAKPSPNR